MTLTDSDNRDTLENIIGRDFNKKNIWDDTWWIPEKERDDEGPLQRDVATPTD